MIKGVEPHELIKQMGFDFKQDLKTKVANYGKNQATALFKVQLLNSVACSIRH